MKKLSFLTAWLSLAGLALILACSNNVGSDSLTTNGPGDGDDGGQCNERCDAVYEECRVGIEGDNEQDVDPEYCEQLRDECFVRCANDDPCGCRARLDQCQNPEPPPCADGTDDCVEPPQCPDGSENCPEPPQCPNGSDNCPDPTDCNSETGECEPDPGCNADSGECQQEGNCNPETGQCDDDGRPIMSCEVEYDICVDQCQIQPPDCNHCVDRFAVCATDTEDDPQRLRWCVDELVVCVDACLPDRPEPPERPEPCDLCVELEDSCIQDTGEQPEWCQQEVQDCWERCQERPIDQQDCIEEYERCLNDSDGQNQAGDKPCEEILERCAGAC